MYFTTQANCLSAIKTQLKLAPTQRIQMEVFTNDYNVCPSVYLDTETRFSYEESNTHTHIWVPDNIPANIPVHKVKFLTYFMFTQHSQLEGK